MSLMNFAGKWWSHDSSPNLIESKELALSTQASSNENDQSTQASGLWVHHFLPKASNDGAKTDSSYWISWHCSVQGWAH